MKSTRRHALKEDRFAQAVMRGVEWSRDHAGAVVAVAAAAVLVAGGSIWWAVQQRRAEHDAAALLSEARAKARGLRYADEAEAKAADVAAIYEEVVARHPGTDAAKLAPLEAGQALLGTGHGAEAAAKFRKVLAGAAPDSPLAQLARRGLANALAAEGDYAAAAAEYSDLAPNPSAYWGLGACQEALGRPEEAARYYNRILETGALPPWRGLASSRLRLLAAREDVPSAELPGPAEAPSTTPEWKEAVAPDEALRATGAETGADAAAENE
jgi:tetratricopeptide (TPR) repeat protein